MFLFLTNSRRRAHKNSQTGPCGCFSRSFRLSPRLCGYFLAGLFSALLWGATPAQAQTCTGPDGNAGDVLYNDSVGMFQGCTLRGWMAFHNPTTPPDCPNIGDTCSDGTVYAGTYGGGRLYVTAADAPGTVVTGGTGSGTYRWNDGTTSYVDLDDASMPNCTPLGAARDGSRWSDQSVPACIGAQGEAFTAYLGTFAGTGSPYKAGSYCYHLGKPSDPSGPANPLAHGRDDWYLPAVDELEFIFVNLGPAPNNGFASTAYWSSTESDSFAAWSHNFSTDVQNIALRDSARRVRCVAR